jgi:AraC-like DNA-binding protein
VINSIYLAWMTYAMAQKNPQSYMFCRLVEEGLISSAHNLAAQRALESTENELTASSWSRCAADMSFLLGRDHEAYAHFQRSLLGVTGSDLAFNVLHFTAQKAISKGDVVTAVRCYSGMTSDQFDTSKKCEGLAGMSLLLFSLGDPETALILAKRLIEISDPHSDWSWLGCVIQKDIRVKQEWYKQAVFRDHVYWHQNDGGFHFADKDKSRNDFFHSGNNEPTLSLMRRKQLDLQVQKVDYFSFDDLYRNYEWSIRDLSKCHLTDKRIEQAMVVIGRNKLEFLPKILASYDPENIKSSECYSDIQQLELSYLFYKLFNSQGNDVTASKHRKNYLLLSANRARLRANVEHWCQAYKVEISSFTGDDVSSRLPARYRRAYNYMQKNLHQKELSVQDIADVINVSSRALQQAFKKYLGESPSAVLRRRRVEHIHSELVNVFDKPSIMDVAKKFGINNRTTLASDYCKFYEKPPSRTLMWGDVDSPG